MISYLIQVTICWALFYLLYALWLEKETFFNVNRWYLLATLFAGMLIPLIEYQFVFAQQSSEMLNPAYYLETITITGQTLETNLEEIVITPMSENWSIQVILKSIYWLGVLFFAGRFLYGMSQIFGLAQRGKVIRKEEYTLVETDSVHLPFSFMDYLFWSKKVVFDPEDHEKILRHELSHIKGFHSIDVVITEMLCIFLWCSPFIFLYKKALKNIHEYLADDNVLKDTPTIKYGQLLLRQSMSGLQIAQANNLIHSQLKKRILMMTKSKSQQYALLKYSAILPLAFLLFFSISAKDNYPEFTAEFTQPLHSDTIPATATSDEIFQVVEEMPRFKGCEDQPVETRKQCADKKMLEFLYKNIKYPAMAKEAGVEGVVVVGFVIEKDGSISNPEIKRSVEKSLDEEVLRIIKTMPRFIPGVQGGKKVRVHLALPVKFSLGNDATKNDKADLPAIKESEEAIFKVAEVMPLFPGTEDHDASNKALMSFIYENLTYPEMAKASAIEGKVVVSFVVTKEGTISNPEIMKSIGGGTDEEVLRVVNQMKNLPGKWVSGKQSGKIVDVQLSLPISFKLDEDAKAKVSKNSNFEKVDIFPNPSGGAINIDLQTKSNAPTTVTILDNVGKQWYKKVFESNHIKIADLDVSNAPNGILIITFEQNGNKITKEVVFQK